MKNAFATLLLLCCVLVARAAAAREPWEYAWTETRSPHFVVLSALGTGRGTELAQSLEDFRFAAKIVTNTGRFDERVLTYVYLVPRTDTTSASGVTCWVTCGRPCGPITRCSRLTGSWEPISC